MKILLHSNAPFTSTGYGQQTAQLVTRLKQAGHDVAVSAFYGVDGATVEWRGVRCYPSDHTKFGRARLPDYAAHFGDGEDVLVLTLFDVWVAGAGWPTLNVASWVPVDHDPLPPRVYQFFAHSGARPIAMSRFGQRELRRCELDALYVPHGIDTEVFRPWEDRDEVRDGLGVPRDAFVVGMVACNKGISPSRKSFPQMFQAFSEFARRHDDAYLYLHSEVLGLEAGINLIALADACSIPEDRWRATDPLMYHLGIEQQQMAGMYSAFDVLANPSHGEGFGIPIVEAQACGVPVIVTDWTSMPELCGAGWVVRGDTWYDAGHGSFFMCPSVAEIIDALEEAYEHAAGMGDQAREHALAYDADLVFATYWQPILEELEVGREEVAPLTAVDDDVTVVAA